MNEKRNRVNELLNKGLSIKEAAVALGFSESTVLWHSSEEKRAYYRKKRNENRAKFVKDLKIQHGGKCSRCGYDRCLAALHFHHLDASSKLRINRDRGVADISRTVGFSAAKAEANKCILLCANCHAEEHNT